MPLANNKDKTWAGWLIDGLGGQEQTFHNSLVAALQSRQIPKCTIKPGTLNMWWRKDSLYIDVISTLDGTMISTIHIQEYGTSLWIGRAFDAQSATWNYYKRMALSAFLRTVDRCIRETILTMVDETAIHDVEDVRKFDIQK